MNDSKYILVTGGAGYIGSHSVVALLEHNYIPIIVDDFRNSHEGVIAKIKTITGSEPIVIRIDICDRNALEEEVFSKYNLTGIIHFAAYKAVGESVEQPLKYYNNNLGGLINCVMLAEKYAVSHFVFSSSCTVYGDPDSIPVTEKSPIKPANSPYGSTKQMAEQIIADVHASGSKMRFLNLRYFNPIGAHPSGLIGELPFGEPNNLLPYITQTAIGIRDQLVVFGNDYPTEDGSCVRDFIHVVDLAEAHIMGLAYLEKLNSPELVVLNVGTGKGHSVLELIDQFERTNGVALNWRFGPRRAGDVASIYADVSQAKRLLGWNAKYAISEAVQHAWNWEKNLKHEK